MTYRDDVVRISIAQARLWFPPRVWRTMRTVRLSHEGATCEVALSTGRGAGAVRGARRWFACPACGRGVLVLGCVEGRGWCCVSCGGWRSRNRRAEVAHASGAVAQLSESPEIR